MSFKGKEAESRLIGWANAVEVCNLIWDDFAQAFDESISAKIADLELTVGAQAEADMARLQTCKTNFDAAFKVKREQHIAIIEESLLSQAKGGRYVTAVYSRHAHEKKKHKRKGRKRDKSKRAHRATGRERGWNMKKGVHKQHRGGRAKKK